MIRKARSNKCVPLENFWRYLISLEVSRKIARVRKRKTNCAIIRSFPFFTLLNSSRWTSFPPSHLCVCILIDHWQRPIIARVASTTLYKLSKRVIRIISKSTFDSHSDPIFKELELLKLSDIRQLELGKLMFSLNHSLLPSKFNNYFSLNKQVHSYATRHTNDFHLPFCRTNLGKFSVSFQGPTYYNSMSI